MSAAIRESGVLGPVIALNLWTFVMEGWMYATRIPAMEKYKIDVNPNTIRDQMALKLPPSVRWVADNYNHLMEQPTQFYAVALAIALLHKGRGEKSDVALAWAYVGIRVVHSFVQASRNHIMTRFSLFLTSSGLLLGLTVNAAKLVLSG
ncbi:hypothetical protein FQN55_007679 [Onygenales sp. PD_40]|nr:hypothetical protein FQN55_007679 [Onygenales sp. PD_40]KAK2789958.1 hypothetical protein FQN52_005766 [Onygenales sp. PD_12]KAK2791043.1 hypothetical protein FQN53_007232 [Emmonsiellopsis sp. PD_33]KAK2806536.1 hypothetical protein FQN51_006502 [Onygenales sp. PD_10]